MERWVCDGDAALCQITLYTCVACLQVLVGVHRRARDRVNVPYRHRSHHRPTLFQVNTQQAIISASLSINMSPAQSNLGTAASQSFH